MKKHLVGKKWEIGPCKKVPPDVKFRIEEALKEISEKKRPREELYEHQNSYNNDVDIQEIHSQGKKSKSGASM